jgi:hypothetical protein
MRRNWIVGAAGTVSVLALMSRLQGHGPPSKAGMKELAAPATELPTEQAVLTRLPFVPPPIERKHPVRLVVHLDTSVENCKARRETVGTR